MKFWFAKKDAADETGAITKEVKAPDTLGFASAEGGEVSASEKPETAAARHEVQADPALEPSAKVDGAAPEAAKSAIPLPILKAVPSAQSGASKIRPIISLKPKAQGAGLAALAAARTAPAEKPDAAVNADKVSESDLKPVAAGVVKADAGDSQTKEATHPDKERATLDSDGLPVRPKPDQRVLYYQLMNGLYDAILILDDKGHVVDCNTRFTDLLGYAREDAWDMPIGKIITGMTSQMLGHLKRNLLENHHIILDARCCRKDGTSFTAEVGVSVFSLTRGENIVFMIRNVERRKKAMDELRKSHAAFEIALVPTFVSDTDGYLLAVNHAFLETFSIPDAENAKAVRFVDLLPDGARIFLRAACGEKIREKMQIMLPDNTNLTLDVVLTPVQSGQSITGVAGSIMQI